MGWFTLTLLIYALCATVVAWVAMDCRLKNPPANHKSKLGKRYRVAIIEDKYSYEVYGSSNEDDEELFEQVVEQANYKKDWESNSYTTYLYEAKP